MRKGITAVIICLFGLIIPASQARASGITFDVIAPHEYDLPVDFKKSFNALVQYTRYNNDNSAFDSNGNRVDGPGTNTVVGLTKYVRFFTLDCLPHVGLAWEVIEPEVSISGNGTSVQGFGDPITGFAGWIKPTANSTLGFQSFVQAPFGDDDISNHSWLNLSSLFFDVNFGKFNIDGQVGGVFSSTYEKTDELDKNIGPIFHASVRLGYKVLPWLEPYLGVDYQNKISDDYVDSGLKVAGSRSNETALGGGLAFYFTDKISAAIRYSHSVAGENVVETNSINFKFTYLF